MALQRRTPLQRGAGLRRTTMRRRRPQAVEVIDHHGLRHDVVADDPDWVAARLVVIERDRGTCCRCGQPAHDPHHRLPRGMGGRAGDPDRHRPDRLVMLCRTCHDWVESNRTKARDAGYLISAGDDATTVRVRMWFGEVTLTADGGMVTWTVRPGR